jgi:LmbE family N-acetylglucosaminyl deacetylase
LGTASATYLYRARSTSSHLAAKPLAEHTPPVSTDRILIFSPHPDDETLGCGGLIQQAVAAGAHVRVVFLTNGDGFRVAVQRQLRTIQVTPDDYVRFAGIRQDEVRAADGKLGLPSSCVTFLGYPDRGLLPMWQKCWSDENPFWSRYTKTTVSPYGGSDRPRPLYSGKGLLAEVQNILSEERPTAVYVTHPSDDHPDHAAASAFVTAAMLQAKDAREGWSQNCELSYYLVHRGDWPNPQGLFKNDRLTPPLEMQLADAKWSSIKLDTKQVETKSQAIEAYQSQTAVMRRFLVSFARTNEVFAKISPVSPDRCEEDSSKWWNEAKDVPSACAGDPVNDNLLRDFQGAGDIRQIAARADSDTVSLRIDAEHPIANDIDYTVQIRYFGQRDMAGSGLLSVQIPSKGGQLADGMEAHVKDRSLWLRIPLKAIGNAKRFGLSVETSVAGIQIDRTGYRFFIL